MARHKMTPEERETFRAKLLETKRKRGVVELKAEGVAFRAHLNNARRRDAEAIATIVHYAIHRLHREALEGRELAVLELVGEFLRATSHVNHTRARAALDDLSRALPALGRPDIDPPPRPSNVIDFEEALERMLAKGARP